MWEKNLKENECEYMYNWITLLYSRNYDNIVNQLYFNKTLKNDKKKEHLLERFIDSMQMAETEN